MPELELCSNLNAAKELHAAVMHKRSSCITPLLRAPRSCAPFRRRLTHAIVHVCFPVHVLLNSTQRFNNGQPGGLRRGAASMSSSGSTEPASVLLDTGTHAVVRAGAVPWGVVKAAAGSQHCSARIRCYRYSEQYESHQLASTCHKECCYNLQCCTVTIGP